MPTQVAGCPHDSFIYLSNNFWNNNFFDKDIVLEKNTWHTSTQYTCSNMFYYAICNLYRVDVNLCIIVWGFIIINSDLVLPYIYTCISSLS